MPDYIVTPNPTPDIGEPFEGGYYTGMIWIELVQSSTVTSITTGIKSFTIPNMTDSPIVYIGQQLEVRSRSNPSDKMIGSVISASETTLSLDITSVNGNGTFGDWSIMTRYRILVAPKKYGEHETIALKSTNTALPLGCQTLNDGWFSTNAMKHAGDAKTYPAAWWARGLNINGYTDWYIPSRDELELCFRNLKPTTHKNYTSEPRPIGRVCSYQINGVRSDASPQHGMNNNSYPNSNAYTSISPKQTSVTTFRKGESEAFNDSSKFYWSSTECSSLYAWYQYWNSAYPGYQTCHNKISSGAVRAVRRSII